MRIIINIDDGNNEIIEIPIAALATIGMRPGYTAEQLDTAKREAQEQLAADLVEKAPDAARAIADRLDEVDAERAKAAAAFEAEPAIADVEAAAAVEEFTK